MATLEHKKEAPVKYSCGVPVEECCGTIDPRFGGKNSNKKTMTLHSSPQEAALCYKRYRVRHGFVRVGNTWTQGNGPLEM